MGKNIKRIILFSGIVVAIAVFLSQRPQPLPSPLETPAPVATAPSPNPSPKPAGPATPNARQAFTEKLARTLRDLPTLSTIRALPPAELHHTPKMVLEAGQALGRILEDIERNPELAPEGQAFFEKCARATDTAEAIRVTCLSTARELTGLTGREANEAGLEARIVEQANEWKK